MKKAFDQTFRDIKRGVNKNVLKVPSIERKILDATSNEPWGPHGSLLADIAQATRNYHEYQMIMAIAWKRINDTGKNWRHVYKGLTVLEYLVAHGSERVIDEIKEHAYQILTLSDFQYIDSSGRDQGSNVRRKSQALVALVNDKEKIQEVRQKAIANRDKFRGPSTTGGMYRPSSYSSSGGYGDHYEEDRYNAQNSYEREREWGYRENDQYARNGDPYGHDVDRYSRDSDEHNARDGYRDDDLRGRRRSIDNYQYGSRSMSSDRGRSYEDHGQYSSRGSVRAASQDGRRHDRKFSEQNLGAPPSYEEAVSDGRSPVHSDRGGENSAAPAPQPPSPPVSGEPIESTVAPANSASPVNQEVEAFDEFDPRGSATAAPPTASTSAEIDLLGSLTDSFPSDSLAIMPAPSEADTPAASASAVNQPFEDPFGDSPFKAITSTDGTLAEPQNLASAPSFQATMNQNTDMSQPTAPKADSLTNFDLGETLPGVSYTAPTPPNTQLPSTNGQFSPQSTTDILADILPPAGPSDSVAPQPPSLSTTGPCNNVFGGFESQAVSMPQNASHMVPQSQAGLAAQPYFNPQFASQHPTGAVRQPDPSASAGALAIVPKPSSKDKFEPKSRVWADSLSRGLVNLDISGQKTNPLADIGIDFDAINRKEKRMEKPAAAPVTSNINMGKAMGSGTGIGRAGATALRAPLNPMMGPGTGMGMGMGMNGMGMGGGYGMGTGMGMGGYGGVNQQPMGMSMGMNMGMNGGMGQGVQMQPARGLPPEGYNPVNGSGYPPQQSYGSGYR